MVFDDLATRLSAEYALFLFALTGRYQQMRAPGVEITPRAVSDLGFATHELASTFYQIAERSFDDYLRPMIAEASESVADDLVTRKMVTLAHLRAMLLENVHQTIKLARTGVNGVGSLLKGSTGAIGLLVQRQAGKVEFKVTDTSGRKWQAEKLFHVVVRDFAYQAWIDKQIADMRLASIEMATNNINAVFPLHEFEDVRHLYFHINSSAIPTPYVPS